MKRTLTTSRPTISDVAALAGVSIKTVSRVVNNEPNVRAPMRERVSEAIRTLGFHPSPSASSLAGRRSYLIGLVYDNPSWSYLINTQQGALQRTEEGGFRLLFHPCDYRNPNLTEEILALVQRMHIEGLILSPPVSALESLVKKLQSNHIRSVRIAPPLGPRDTSAVFADDCAASRRLCGYLIELGHRRIGFVLGHPDHTATAARHAGYRQALENAGIEIDDALTVAGRFTFESGKAAAHQLLGQPVRPTAIIASNDDMAAGVISVAHSMGVRLPEQLSVCGFDDLPLATVLWPQLTTMRQPVFEMAYEATDMLLRSIETGSDSIAQRQFQFELIKRKSTARFPTGPSE